MPFTSYGIPFIFLALMIGLVVTFLSSRVLLWLSTAMTDAASIPYTVIVFLIGIVIVVSTNAAVVHNNADTTGQSGDALTQFVLIWENVSPLVLLYVLLPVLIFEEAMGLSPHQASERTHLENDLKQVYQYL